MSKDRATCLHPILREGVLFIHHALLTSGDNFGGLYSALEKQCPVSIPIGYGMGGL
jgi:hypothetical protein